jgi:ribosomal protein S18 acetylase RimI-like enzyme
MPTIRPFQAADWAELWPILKATFESGDSYAFAPDSTEAEIRRAWIDLPQATYVAVSKEGHVVGTYTLKPNQPGLGGHVCNCGYVVAEAARGRGIAARMCEHSQAEARAAGFRAMQFNLVVSTNESAVRLWRRLGFEIVGALPGAFRHRVLGDVDAYVMFKTLAA